MRLDRIFFSAIISIIIILPLYAERNTHTPAKGIYLTQSSVENTKLLNHLIERAEKVGINTFIIDLDSPTKRYRENVALVLSHHIQYVARIVMFDGGATDEDIEDPRAWQHQYALVKQAIDWGASSIQLDYIRYSTKEPASSLHAQNINKILAWYKTKLAQQNIPLQVDVFGITSLGEEKHIGQSIPLFAQTVDAICPMVYPSHFVPFDKHFSHPYDTVYDSLLLFQKQFNNHMPIKMYAYIELTNYHYTMSRANTLNYIRAQIKAVEDAHADGWYAWSPHNRYENLFDILEASDG